MTKIKIISDQAELEQLCSDLITAPWLAIDTEFMREKTYAPILCLIQIASQHDAYCIDPLAIADMGSFSKLLGGVDQQKILHSCRQDLEAFATRLDAPIEALFDTQIAAAFCGYGGQVSYATMVENITGVKLAKSHTRADWQARPLSDAELDYAMDDVNYLYAVKQSLEQQLIQNGRSQWFAHECIRQLDPTLWKVAPDTAWQRLRGAASLPNEAHATAKRLAIWREQKAIARNRPREWIISTKALLQASKFCPDSAQQLRRIDGINTGIIKQSGSAILDICAATPRDKAAMPLWHNPDLFNRKQKRTVKRVMAMIRETAEAMQMSPALFANRYSIEKFVCGEQQIALFEGWRYEVVGAKIQAQFGSINQVQSGGCAV